MEQSSESLKEPTNSPKLQEAAEDQNEVDLNEKKRAEFEILLEAQKAKRENFKQEKQQNIEKNKDPNEMMLVIQRNFREKYDAINKEIEENKEGINLDTLFQNFNELKSYFINASYSLTPYDKRLYGEQLDKLEKTLQELREKTQKREKFSFKKKNIGQKKEQEVKEKVEAPKEVEKTDFLSLLKGIENKKDENVSLEQNDLEDSFKLQNLENCEINLNGRMKTLYLKNLKGCQINIGVLEGACFIDGCTDCNLQLVAHQVRIHNSKNTRFKLFATSKPIIEHCTSLKFGQYDYKYDNFEKDLADAKFSGRPNLWNQVQDFNWHKLEKSPNFDLI